MQFHYWSQSCIFYRAWICNQSITSKYCNAIVHRFFPKKMWFLTLQITINATSLEQLCEHEYVLSCQVERTPRWPPAASSVPRAVERTCPEAPTSAHTHTSDIYFPAAHTITTTIASCTSGLLVWRRTACKLCSTTNETLQPKVICLPPPSTTTTTTTHICVVSARAREYLQPSLNEVTRYVPTGRGPGYTARTARRSLMRRLESPSIRAGIG